ncbi:MAG: IS3 family transposase [Comamonadaceae bacterium]|jgi:putative transposase|nr:IS3 family transposase [Comamonadaceae bacterium]
MSRAGEVWDNSAMESFFCSLKTERTARKGHRTRGQARSDTFDNIECFYNPTRRHSTIGHLSPEQLNKLKKLRSVSTRPAATQIVGPPLRT